MFYCNIGQFLTENIQDLFLIGLERKEIYFKKTGKSYIFWTSKNFFTKLREKGSVHFSVKGFKVKT